MKYLSGIHALNVPCEEYGNMDWHRGSLDWSKEYLLENNKLLESEKSILKEWQINREIQIVGFQDKVKVASIVRAICDMILNKEFTYIEGVKNYLCLEKQQVEDICYKIKEVYNEDEEIEEYMGYNFTIFWMKIAHNVECRMIRDRMKERGIPYDDSHLWGY